MIKNFIKECHSNLINNKSSDAIEYLSSRDVSNESIVSYQIGYCEEKQELHECVKHFGKDADDYQNAKYNDGYSYFIQGRLILPIYSEFDDIAGFATRKPSHEQGNTWWNTPRPFKKGNHLFSMNKAREHAFKENKIYIVEGYMDAISVFQSGLKNVVALMGTALTSRKIGLIARYCDNICLALDVDENEAGQKATEKSIYILNEFNLFKNISVLDIPIKEDPASYLMKHSLNDFLNTERQITDKDILDICKKMRQRATK